MEASLSQCGGTVLREETISEIRRAYLEIIQLSNWKELFLETALTTLNNLDQWTKGTISFGIKSSQKTEYVEFSQSLIMIGRKPGNDVVLSSDHASRLSCMVFLMKDSFAIVDCGGICGIKILSRSGEGPLLESSEAAGRKVIKCEKEETVVLQIGQATLCSNPKMCLICWEKPRY
jgi:hypothetical protein